MLQCYMWLVATCVGPGGLCRWPHFEMRFVATSTYLGQLNKRPRVPLCFMPPATSHSAQLLKVLLGVQTELVECSTSWGGVGPRESQGVVGSLYKVMQIHFCTSAELVAISQTALKYCCQPPLDLGLQILTQERLQGQLWLTVCHRKFPRPLLAFCCCERLLQLVGWHQPPWS